MAEIETSTSMSATITAKQGTEYRIRIDGAAIDCPASVLDGVAYAIGDRVRVTVRNPRRPLIEGVEDPAPGEERSAPPADTDWIAFPGANGWVNFGGTWETLAYRRRDGIVHLRGLGTGGAAVSFMGQLPVGFRVSGNRHFPVAAGGTIGIINVYADGWVRHNSGPVSWVSLDGVTYPADN